MGFLESPRVSLVLHSVEQSRSQDQCQESAKAFHPSGASVPLGREGLLGLIFGDWLPHPWTEARRTHNWILFQPEQFYSVC